MAQELKEFCPLAIGALVVLTLPALVAPHSNPQNPEAVDALVAMIRGTIGDAPTAGAGILLGVTSDRLYIATADHVVRKGTRDVQHLEVQLKWLPGEWFAARLLEHSDTTLDLAVLAVPDATRLSVPNLTWQALSRPDSLVPGTKVFPIGYPAGNAWFKTLQPHLVSTLSSGVIRAEGNLVPGHSGGALVTADGGIVGLVSSVDGVAGESQRIDRVIEKLTEWGYSVSLTWKPTAPSAPPNATTSVETRRESLTPLLPAAFANLAHIDAAFEITCPGTGRPGSQLYLVAESLAVRYDFAARGFAEPVPVSEVLHGLPFSRIDAAYLDSWHYGRTPQLYLFSGVRYARYDLCPGRYEGSALIEGGYRGLPFRAIDAAYVDEWHYGLTPQLYVFSGPQYARWDILKNSYEASASIQAGYPGVTFRNVDAAFVDAWRSPASPQLYLLSGQTFARFDLLTNRTVTVDSTRRLRP